MTQTNMSTELVVIRADTGVGWTTSRLNNAEDLLLLWTCLCREPPAALCMCETVTYLQYISKSTEFDALHIQTAQQALDHRLVLHLSLKADEVHGALGNSEGWELLRRHHGLHSLHHLPVGDALAWKLKLGQCHTDGNFGNGLEVQVVFSREAQGLCGIMDDGRHGCRWVGKLQEVWRQSELLAHVSIFVLSHCNILKTGTPFRPGINICPEWSEVSVKYRPERCKML